MENLTNEIEAKAWKYIEKIDAMGGAVSAIEAGYMQEEIAKSSYDYQNNIERGDKLIVGMNEFTEEASNDIPLLRIDDSIRKVQSEKLAQLRASRDAEKVNTCLADLHNTATENRNIMPSVIEAVDKECTLGEISDVLRKIYGEYSG